MTTPFARGETVGFQHDGKSELAAAQHGNRLSRRVARLVARRRHVTALHELLGEHLARLETRGALRRAEQEIAFGGEHVGDAAAQRQLGSDDREIDLFAAGDRGDRVGVGRIDRDASRHAADPGVSGRAHDVRHGALGRQFPHQRVFAPAVADDQNSRGTHVLCSKLLDIKGLK